MTPHYYGSIPNFSRYLSRICLLIAQITLTGPNKRLIKPIKHLA